MDKELAAALEDYLKAVDRLLHSLADGHYAIGANHKDYANTAQANRALRLILEKTRATPPPAVTAPAPA